MFENLFRSPKVIDFGSVITKLEVPYTLYERGEPCDLDFFLDLSSARYGDEFRVCIYTRLISDWALYEEYTVRGEQLSPIFSVHLCLPAVRIEIKQTAGIAKRVDYMLLE